MEPPDGFVHQRRHVTLLADVGRYGERFAAGGTDVVDGAREVGTRARGENDVGAFGCERARNRPADAAAGAGDDRDLPREPARRQIWSPRPDLISSMNSARVSGRSRNAPSIADVTAFEFCFSTPRMIMQR